MRNSLKLKFYYRPLNARKIWEDYDRIFYDCECNNRNYFCYWCDEFDVMYEYLTPE